MNQQRLQPFYTSASFSRFPSFEQDLPPSYPPSIAAPSERKSPSPPPRRAKFEHNSDDEGRREGFFRRYRNVLRAIPAAAGAILWSTQMVHFLVYFGTLPALQDGSWPRIGPEYAAYPFISCIGAVLETEFKTICVTTAVLVLFAFWQDYIIGRRALVGRWWRLWKVSLATISCIFLIGLPFASVNRQHRLHLIFTSFQIMGMGTAKVCDWSLNIAMRRRTPNIACLETSRAYKRFAGIIGFPSSVISIIGIYGCKARLVDDSPIFSRQCWNLVSFAAPAEWMLGWCWVIYLGTVSYDAYHLDYVVRQILTTPSRPKGEPYGWAFWKFFTKKVDSVGVGEQEKDYRAIYEQFPENSNTLVGSTLFNNNRSNNNNNNNNNRHHHHSNSNSSDREPMIDRNERNVPYLTLPPNMDEPGFDPDLLNAPRLYSV